jgi:predicted dehydrogenase
MKQIRIGLIGLGNMGKNYAVWLSEGKIPELSLVAVTAGRKESRDWAEQKLGKKIRIFQDGEELMDSGICEAVLIATPHARHPEMVRYALQRGLHVLCEKPAGVDVRQVRLMNEAAEKSDCVFGMMYNQRTNSLYRKIHEMMQNGELGNLKRVNWIVTDWYRTQSYYDSGSWRATWAGEGGGVLINQCPHNLDLLQWMFGMPNKIRAFCHEGKWHNIEVEDDVTAYLEYPNGATGVFLTSTGDAPGSNRLEVTTDRGKLLCENGKLIFYRLEENERTFCKSCPSGFLAPKYEMVELKTDGKNEQHLGVLKSFAGKILYGTPQVAEGREGIFGLTLSNAMYLSSWLERTIELPLDEELFVKEFTRRQKEGKHGI